MSYETLHALARRLQPSLHSMFPSQDGAQAVCIWEAWSVEDVRSSVGTAPTIC